MKSILVTSLFLITIHFTSFGQSNIDWSLIKFKNDSISETHEYKVITNEGATLLGELIGIKNGQISIQTVELGLISVDMSKVQSIVPIDELDNPTPDYMVGNNHYLIAPSPYGLEKGEFNLQNSEIFLFSTWYGVSEHFTIGGGFTVLPGVSFEDQLFYIIPKFSFDIAPQIKASVQLTQLFFQDEAEVSLLTFSTGFGKPDRHISVGYSAALNEGAGVINFGGVYRVGRKFAFLLDGYLPNDGGDGNIIGFGGRIIGKSSSFDFGFLSSAGEDGTIPWLNYTVRF